MVVAVSEAAIEAARAAYVEGDRTLQEFEDAVERVLEGETPAWVRERRVERSLLLGGCRVHR